MNKDVIYIEPEDDITDIITKIEKAKSKIVALVPPKKAGVFRSIVNIKLIAKSGASAEKTIVLVTADPSIVKLAAATKLPVAKNLQSAPVVPKVEADIAKGEPVEVEDIVEEDESEEEIAESKKVVAPTKPAKEQKSEATESEDDEENEDPFKKDDKKSKKKDDKPKSSNKIIAWITDHKKIAIFGGIGCVALIIFLVWALVIAPKATLTVGIKTDQNNFSENVKFVTNLNDENADDGKFFLDEKKIESSQEVQFDATGSKNVGQKASGEVVVYAYFKDKGTVPINAGSDFSINGLTYTSNKAVILSWDGEDTDVCDNENNASQLIKSGCQISGRVSVTANEPGAKYNIAASNAGWSTTANVAVYSDSGMTGGTDDIKTVVQQSDIDKAKSELASSNESANKEKLYKDLGDNVIVIDASFSQKTSEATSTPAVGEEVGEGTKPTLKATTTTSVYVIDKTKVEEFITKKADLGESKKIYAMKDPFVENFVQTDGGYTGKLKTSYSSGPKITENDIVEKVKGKGLGEAQHDLKDIEGVASVNINTSFPWVTSIPGDPNKITVILEVQE